MANRRDVVTDAKSSASLTHQIFARELATWVKFDPLAREGIDPEGVHQLRVTSRRLRAELSVLAPLLSRKLSQDLAKELRWIGKILGRQRDFDVLSGLLIHLQHEDAPYDSSVLSRLQRHREAERRRVRNALTSSRYQRLARDLATWAVSPPLRRRARSRASDVLRPGLLAGLVELFHDVDSVGPNATDETLHQLRITIKHARYRAEVASSALGANVNAVAKDLARAQGVLGDLHDRVVASSYLYEWRTSRWPIDKTNTHDPVEIALSALADEMTSLRQAWRAPLAKARRHSTALYLIDEEESTTGGA